MAEPPRKVLEAFEALNRAVQVSVDHGAIVSQLGEQHKAFGRVKVDLELQTGLENLLRSGLRETALATVVRREFLFSLFFSLFERQTRLIKICFVRRRLR